MHREQTSARHRALAAFVMVVAALIGYFVGGDSADAQPGVGAPESAHSAPATGGGR